MSGRPTSSRIRLGSASRIWRSARLAVGRNAHLEAARRRRTAPASRPLRHCLQRSGGGEFSWERQSAVGIAQMSGMHFITNALPTRMACQSPPRLALARSSAPILAFVQFVAKALCLLPTAYVPPSAISTDPQSPRSPKSPARPDCRSTWRAPQPSRLTSTVSPMPACVLSRATKSPSSGWPGMASGCTTSRRRFLIVRVADGGHHRADDSGR